MNDDTVQPDIDESIRRTFEAAWNDGTPQPIEDVIGDPDSENYLATLEELVQIDLEFRWKLIGDGDAPKLEEYLERFSELAEPEILARLVQQEIELRVATGQRPDEDEYRERFPEIEVEVPATDEAGMDTGVEEQAEFDTSQEMATIQAPSLEKSGGSRNSATIQGVERPQKPVVLEGDAIPGYDLLGELGRGGMGVVYKARDQKLKRVVALKMILGGGHASDDDTLRFQTEAEAVAKLQHPNIVQIYEVGDHEGRPYISLEYAAGGNLDGMIAGTPQNAIDSAALIESLARAMQVAHEHDIIHRDLKPANILITGDGEPKITDFGLAKKMDDDSQQTKSGAVMGTPSYMPPEQAASNKDTLGPGADVYALGAILYHMVTGRPPFHAETQLDTLMQVIGEEPLAPRKLNSTLPVDLETICLKCLQKDISHRYESAEALAEDLRRFQNHEPIEARPVSIVVRGWKWARRRPAIAALISVSLAATVAIIVGGVMFTLALKTEKQKLLRSEYFLQGAKDVAEKKENQAKIAEQDAKEAHQAADEQRGLAEEQTALAEEQRMLAEKREAEAIEAQEQARRAEAGANRLLANTHVSNGARLLQEGDTTGALEWFARAQAVKQDDEQENRIALMRTWSTLQQTPRPAWERTELAVGNQSFLMNISTNRALNQKLTISGDRLGELALLDRKQDRILALYDGHTGGMKDLVRIWDVAAAAQSVEEISEDITSKHRFFEHLFLVAWSPDKTQMATIRRHALNPIAAVAAKLRNEEIPDCILETSLLENWKTVFSRPLVAPYSLQYDSSGNYLLTMHNGRIGRLWNASTGEPVAEPQKHEYENVWKVTFTPDGKKMVLLTYKDQAIQVWDLADGTLDFEITDFEDGLQRLTTGPKGKWAAVATNDHILLLNLETKKLAEAKLTPTGKAYELEKWQEPHLVFSPNAKLLLMRRSKFLQVWNTDTWDPMFDTLEHESRINHAAFDAEGVNFLTCCDDGQVRIWNSHTGQLSHAPLNHDGQATWADFDQQGRTVFTFSSFNTLNNRQATLRSWDLASTLPVSRTLRHQRRIRTTSFHPDGKTVLTAGDDGRVHLWDVESGAVRLTILVDDYLKRAFFSRDGKAIVTQTRHSPQVVRLWDSMNGEALSPAISLSVDAEQLSLNADSTRLTTIGANDKIHVWDVQEGTAVEMPTKFLKEKEYKYRFVNGAKDILSMSGGSCTLINVESGEKVWGPRGIVVNTLDRLAVSPTNNFFGAVLPTGVTSGSDSSDRDLADNYYSTLFIYSLETGEKKSQVNLPRVVVSEMVFSPDGMLIAVGCEDGRVLIWNVETGLQSIPPLQHAGQINDISFSRDSNLLVSASATSTEEGAVQVWDVTTGQPVTPPLVHPKGEMVLASFSPDGKNILAAPTSGEEVLIYPLTPMNSITRTKILDAALALTTGHRSEEVKGDDENDLNWAEIRKSLPGLSSPSERTVTNWHEHQSVRAMKRRDYKLAEKHMEPVVESENGWNAYMTRAYHKYMQNNFEDASRDFQAAMEQGLPPGSGWWQAASVALANQDIEEYQRICQLGVDRLFDYEHQVFDNNGIANASVFLPDTFESYDRLLEKTSQTAGRHTEDSPAPYSLFCHGAVLYRAGQFEQAKQVLEDSILWDTKQENKRENGQYGSNTYLSVIKEGKPRIVQITRSWLFLAMAEYQLGNKDQAHRLYDASSEAHKNYRKPWDNATIPNFILMEVDRYLEEARLLLGVEEEKPEEDAEVKTTDK